MKTRTRLVINNSFSNLYKTGMKNFSGGNKPNNIELNRTNFIINICKQNEDIVIERLGKFSRIQKSGIYFAIPILDKIRYVFDNRELTVAIDPQHATTQDNVTISIAGTVYIKFVDAYKTAYGVSDPIFAVSQFAQSAMRAVVGKNTLDELFHNRSNLNDYIIKALEEGTKSWGIAILRYEITDIIVSNEIRDAMLRQASAERKRREDVLHAEALKRSQILESEGLKQKLINESEGKKIQIENEASAEANSIKIKADAKKYEIIVNAEAKAQALEIIGQRLTLKEGQQAAQIELAKSYIEEFGKIIGKSNNVVIPKDINDIGGVVARAMSIAQMVNVKNENKSN